MGQGGVPTYNVPFTDLYLAFGTYSSMALPEGVLRPLSSSPHTSSEYQSMPPPIIVQIC